VSAHDNRERGKRMDARTHARLKEIFNIFALGFVAVILVGILVSKNAVLIVVYAIVSWPLSLFLWLVPIRCATPGCKGTMRKSHKRVSDSQVRRIYECPLCHIVYEVEIYETSDG
jgi:hypothetical protein